MLTPPSASIFPAHLWTEDQQAERAPDAAWWATYTRASCEKTLAEHLFEREIAFFLPLFSAEDPARKGCLHLPIFRRYLFFHGTEDDAIAALSSGCIVRIVPVREQTQLDKDLQQIHRLIESRTPLQLESYLPPGEPVRIGRGSLSGLDGTIFRRNGRNHFAVAVHCLSQGVSIDIDDAMLDVA